MNGAAIVCVHVVNDGASIKSVEYSEASTYTDHEGNEQPAAPTLDVLCADCAAKCADPNNYTLDVDDLLLIHRSQIRDQLLAFLDR